jgi:hypothetical protein
MSVPQASILSDLPAALTPFVSVGKWGHSCFVNRTFVGRCMGRVPWCWRCAQLVSSFLFWIWCQEMV